MQRVALLSLPTACVSVVNFPVINCLTRLLLLASGVQFPLCLRISGKRSERHLTTLFSNAAITTATPIDVRPPRKKLGWLPLLTVLFCISYALMTMLIIEQGATIESQRVLIRELFRDSAELSATKIRAQHDKAASAQNSQAPSSKTQVPSTQAPSTQAQNQAPSSQTVPQHPAAKIKPQVQMPSRPASDLSDERRALITI